MEFIDSNFKSGHKLSYDDALFDFFYKHNNDKYNFSVIYDSNNELASILGYIPSEKWSRNDDITWLALWSSKPKKNSGILLLMNLLRTDVAKGRGIGVLGLSDVALQIYQKLGFNTGKMNHYFLRNNHLSEFTILSSKALVEGSAGVCAHHEHEHHFLDTLDIVRGYKNLKIEYYRNKYQNNPFTKYKFLFISDKEKNVLFVMKENHVNKAVSLTIVDVAGELDYLNKYTSVLTSVLHEKNYEYIDFLCNLDVINTDIWEVCCKANFAPLHFSPFERKYVELNYALKDICNEKAIFKGDGDQERP